MGIFGRMLRIGAALALAMISVVALASGRGTDKDAAEAVQGFLAAAEAGDATAFEAALDRPALRSDLRRQMLELSRSTGIDVDGGPSDLVLDRMLSPEAVRLAVADAGPVADHLKKTGKTEVCLTEASPEAPCLLTFAKGKGKPGWRLVGMQAQARPVEVGVDFGH